MDDLRWSSRLRRCTWVLLISTKTRDLLHPTLPASLPQATHREIMILFDDVLEVKEEAAEVRAPLANAIPPPPPYTESRDHGEESDPLLPVASRYSNRKTPSSRRRFLKAFFAAWAVWVMVLCLIVGWKNLLKVYYMKPGVSSIQPHNHFVFVYIRG